VQIHSDVFTGLIKSFITLPGQAEHYNCWAAKIGQLEDQISGY
jgi:hypothetical protein